MVLRKPPSYTFEEGPSPGGQGRSHSMHVPSRGGLLAYSVWLQRSRTWPTGLWEFPWCSGYSSLCPDLLSGLRPSFAPRVSLKTALSWRERSHPRSCPLPRGNLHPMTSPHRSIKSWPPCFSRGHLCRTISASGLVEGRLRPLQWIYRSASIPSAQPCFFYSPTGVDPQALPRVPPTHKSPSQSLSWGTWPLTLGELRMWWSASPSLWNLRSIQSESKVKKEKPCLTPGNTYNRNNQRDIY